MFYQNPIKLQQWNAFLVNNDLKKISLEEAVKAAQKLLVLIG